MIRNYMVFFKIESCSVNVAGEESDKVTKSFSETDSDGDLKVQKQIKDFVQSILHLNHIERMEFELSELCDNINKAEEFLYKEYKEPKFLDEKQKELLKLQVSSMKHYHTTLKHRMDYEKLKIFLTEENKRRVLLTE